MPGPTYTAVQRVQAILVEKLRSCAGTPAVHTGHLMRALRLCERFLTHAVGSREELDRLKADVALALSKPVRAAFSLFQPLIRPALHLAVQPSANRLRQCMYRHGRTGGRAPGRATGTSSCTPLAQTRSARQPRRADHLVE